MLVNKRSPSTGCLTCYVLVEKSTVLYRIGGILLLASFEGFVVCLSSPYKHGVMVDNCHRIKMWEFPLSDITFSLVVFVKIISL